jgi:hypothetical protein
MNALSAPVATTARSDLRDLNGQIVLVRSSRDQRNPPTAMRGWIEVSDAPGTKPAVSIALEFPQMFSTAAHHRTIPLDEASLEQLRASEHNGVFEFTLEDELN